MTTATTKIRFIQSYATARQSFRCNAEYSAADVAECDRLIEAGIAEVVKDGDEANPNELDFAPDLKTVLKTRKSKGKA